MSLSSSFQECVSLLQNSENQYTYTGVKHCYQNWITTTGVYNIVVTSPNKRIEKVDSWLKVIVQVSPSESDPFRQLFYLNMNAVRRGEDGLKGLDKKNYSDPVVETFLSAILNYYTEINLECQYKKINDFVDRQLKTALHDEFRPAIVSTIKDLTCRYIYTFPQARVDIFSLGLLRSVRGLCTRFFSQNNRSLASEADEVMIRYWCSETIYKSLEKMKNKNLAVGTAQDIFNSASQEVYTEMVGSKKQSGMQELYKLR